MVASLALSATGQKNPNKKHQLKNKTKTHSFFSFPEAKRDFVQPPLRGYSRCATQNLIGAYNHTFANIVVAAQRDSLAVIPPKRGVAKGHLSG